ncbi:MAG: GNAT family N-acetyltransferase [Oscillospiraceae bacterium]|nr:GNAT family N-acetyltransferase [Oscillospiraceae bacterium]
MITIRKIKREDRACYLEMAKDFYSSDAVHQNIPGECILRTFHELMRSEQYLLGYIMEYKGKTAGYALLAKTFSQEAGGMVLWIDELYVLSEYRRLGLGRAFFSYLKNNLCGNIKRIRLEAESGNQEAISLYKRMGFQNLPYMQMIQDL